MVDFEKVNSLEGVFLANKFESEALTSDTIIPVNKKLAAATKPKKEFT